MKHKKGIFIGRFQPFHKGHLRVIRLMQKECEEIIIGIGSAQYANESKNPLNVYARRKLIRYVLDSLSIDARIVSIDDVPDDRDWMKSLQETNFDVIYSSNLWVLNLARSVRREDNVDVNIVDVKPLVDSDETRDISATRIRRSIRNGTDDWKKMVPKEVKELIESKYLKYF